MRTFLAALALAAPVAAQGRTQFEQTMEKLLESRYETTASLAGSEHTRVLWGAYTTFSFLAVDDTPGNTHIQRQVDSRVWGQIDRKGHTVYGRLRFAYRDWNTGDSFDGNDDHLVSPIGDRYWYRFDWRRHQRATSGRDTRANFWLQAGRQYIQWASGIVLSDDLFAVRGGLDAGRFSIEGFGAQTPSDTIDYDASRPGFSGDTDRDFYGAQITFRGASHQPYLFFLGQHDNNNTVVPGPFGPATYDYDSSYFAIGSIGQISGQLLYRIEIIHESGEAVSDIASAPQTTEDVEAWAGRFELALAFHRFRHTSRLRLELEFLAGTGDDDRVNSNQTLGGNISGTRDESFNAFGFANTGLVLAPELANLISVRLTARLFPLHGKGVFDELQITFDVFYFSKLDDDAPVSFASVSGAGTLGVEFDLSVTWNVMSDLAVDLRYGILLPGSALPISQPRHFFYFGVSYGF